MSANVETMFSVRETPWHGLGRIVMDAPASREALELAGLDWQVESRNIYSGTGAMIPGYRANVRSTDEAVLGVVSDRYRIVQNEEAFQFTDDLLGEGVTYETAGSLQGGKKVWMLAKLPEKYIIAGDEVTPYLVFFNSHDGSSGVKVAMTPVRVVCQNTLNLALGTAKRIWTARHTENVLLRVQDARETLGRNLEIKQKIESAVVKTIESVPEKVLKPEHIETRNQKWEGQTYPGTDVSYRKKRICTGWKIKGRRLPEI